MTGIGFFKRLLGAAAHEPDAPHRLQAPAGTRVLVVDDSPTILAVLGKQLDQEGYATLKAADGEEQPALIFLDIVLPGINGFKVLRTLRHDPLTRDIPIVMISGNQQATEQFYVQRFGADDFIKKPFGRAELTTCIHKLVLSGRLAAREIVREMASPPMPEESVVPESVAGIAA